MGPYLSSATSPPLRLPRLLIAEKNFSAIEPLIRTCGDGRLDVDFDVASSPRGAVGMLLASSYQLVISGAHLTEMEDFLLLKRTQALETFVPVVVTASASEKESARRVLEHGAFDLITTPLEHEQAVDAIRLALWESKLMTLIACKEKTLQSYRDHIAAYPTGNEIDRTFKMTLSAIDQSIVSYQRTILRTEECTTSFSELATKVECYSRKRALERLDTLIH
ncbi:MAG TPA: response regulator [Nitrospira sp.]|nr:response regulator [Nitrospira sp.]